MLHKYSTVDSRRDKKIETEKKRKRKGRIGTR